ncbi:MAG: hypothetical protein ACRDKA_08075 [Actinomycetota bacterium]
MTESAERVMVRRAAAAGALAAPVALAAGLAADGTAGAWSALLAMALVVANFAAHGLSLSWAATISIPVLQAVALGGFVVRMAVFVGALFALDRAPFFRPAIFAVAAVASILSLLVYETRLAVRGLGAGLRIPPDPAAAAAAERLRAREASP